MFFNKNLGPLKAPALVFLTLITSACGSFLFPKRPPPQAFERVTVSLVPSVDYKEADPLCLKGEKEPLKDLKDLSFRSRGWDELSLAVTDSTEFRLDGFYTRPYLNSAAIYRVDYGRVLQMTCQNTFESLKKTRDCLDAAGKKINLWNVSQTDGGTINYCDQAANFEGDTFEGIGGFALSNIQRAYEWAIESTSHYIPSLRVNVLPKYLRQYQSSDGRTVELTEVDNMYYSSDGINATISILPESESAVKERTGLFHVVFPIIHEYGHHVEFQILKAATKAINRPDIALSLKWSPHAGGYTRFSDSVKSEEDRSKKFLTALSEGVADVFAIYVREGNFNDMKQTRNFESSRNPLDFVGTIHNSYGTPYFFDKNLTELRISMLTHQRAASSKNKIVYISPVEQLFEDEHYVGAVFAHYWFEISNILTENDPLNKNLASKNYKKNLSVFLKLYESVIRNVVRAVISPTTTGFANLSPREYADLVPTHTVEYAKAYLPQESMEAVCEKTNLVFPEYTGTAHHQQYCL